MRKCINLKLEWMKNYDFKKKKKPHHMCEAGVMKLVSIMVLSTDYNVAKNGN